MQLHKFEVAKCEIMRKKVNYVPNKQICVIIYEANHNNLSAAKIQQKLKLPVIAQHIAHTLKSTPYAK